MPQPSVVATHLLFAATQISDRSGHVIRLKARFVLARPVALVIGSRGVDLAGRLVLHGG